ncbi:calcium/potassium channel (CAKC) [Trypanosoma rangeli]|uniref:Calcium/potassium channel (CAKC) n=1 Tax=Trypanosoma rangeli TaxID=5698 RepID=A0A3R7MPS7_TRYRA|nr:calcium/potassium channel (CAKC) [Trypanosoma rangeli]RNF09318.1 calcium/potassium channel (CAKC) [Trypanosoma rangeli]|eukprot:RNF09318.1 calcium/potassium channel (CAKC) [Trypanosoma rangeli]
MRSKKNDRKGSEGSLPAASPPGPVLPCAADAEAEAMRDTMDLTMVGRYKCYAKYVPHVASWRFRDQRQERLTRRSALLRGSEYYKKAGTRISCQISWWTSYFSYRCGPRWRAQPPFGFPMMTGPRRSFQVLVRRYPVVAVCIWLFLFLCETAMVILYIMQTAQLDTVTWVNYSRKNFDWYATVQTILSLVLLSQLVVAHSVSTFTIIVVLGTSGYRIITYFVALVSGLGWVSRMYVPLFLRCWAMRQYFLFLLDSFAMLTPRNHRLDVIRLAAGPLSFFFALLFTFGCIFHIYNALLGHSLGIWNALYWVVVTASTVGFGDIVPSGLDGRALALVFVLTFLATIPTWVLLAISTLRILREFPRYKGRKRQFFVYGQVSYEDAVSILEEVLTLYPMKVVCFCYSSFSPEVLAIGRHPRYRMRSSFYQVRLLDRRMMERLQISEASAIIILPGAETDSSNIDADVMLWSITFQRHAPHVPQFLRLRLAFHAKLLGGHRRCIFDQNNKFIMSTALLLPGILPFLVNLVRVASASGTSPPDLWDERSQDNWKSLYEYSRRNNFATCPVPWYFVRLSLSRVVRLLKMHDVLVVGVEEAARNVMRLDLRYILEQGDTLLVLHEGNLRGLAEVLLRLDPDMAGATQPFDSSTFANNNSFESNPHGDSVYMSRQDLLELELDSPSAEMSDVKLYYPFNTSSELCGEGGGMTPLQQCNTVSPVGRECAQDKPGPSSAFCESRYSDAQVWELRWQLLQQPFVDQHPNGVSLKELPLGGSMAVLRELLGYHRAAVAHASGTMEEAISRLEQQVNDVLAHIALEYLGRIEKEDGVENFLFLDQVSSFCQPAQSSLYEKYLDEVISKYELVRMMQSIQSIYPNSRLTLLTSRKLSNDFLLWWKLNFGFSLCYIRGLSTSESHLDYAIQRSGGRLRLRGILLYCSQLGRWDFSDIPLITVENNVTNLMDLGSQVELQGVGGRYSQLTRLFEQNLVVELKSFVSCISVIPYHTDPAWRRRGEEQFQDSLAFMMGRCFSPNMLQTIFIHAHRDHRIMQFFEMVLCQQGNDDLYDPALWSSYSNTSTTRFKVCGNQLLHFRTFGDAFSFLLSRHSWITIGVFRRFPASEKLPGVARYFITNPPLRMPLRPDDVMYALSASSHVYNRVNV